MLKFIKNYMFEMIIVSVILFYMTVIFLLAYYFPWEPTNNNLFDWTMN